MNELDLPVACSLTDTQLQERRQSILQKAGRAVLETKETESGYAYRFPSDDNWLNELTHLIQFERRCCRFLKFTMTVEPGDGPIWLELTGPQGTKDFLATFLN